MSTDNQPVERTHGGYPLIPSPKQGTAFHPTLGKTGAFKSVDCKGLFAGLTAGLILALLYLVDYGPGTNLHTVAKWFGLDSKDAGGYIGFVLLLILGALFGLAFGAFQRTVGTLSGACGARLNSFASTLTRAIVSGLILGAAWFVILVLLLGIIVGHMKLGTYGFMLFIATSLLYGLLVGMLYYQNPLSRASK